MSVNYGSFTKPILRDMQSLKTIGCDRDLWPSRLRRDVKSSRPRLAEMGLETRLETETKSITDLHVSADLWRKDEKTCIVQHFTSSWLAVKIMIAFTAMA